VSTERVRPQTHTVGEMTATRYRVEDADYAVVIHPGAAAGSSVMERFCASHAARAVDVWCVDPSSNGRPEFIDSPTASITLGTHAVHITGLPLFLFGFGTGAAVAYHALHASDAFWGAVLADDLPAADATLAGRRQQQEGLANFWVDRVLSRTTQYHPPVGRVTHNLAPMFCAITEDDPALACRKANAIISLTVGHAQIYRHPADMVDLMASGFGGDIMHEWCLTQLSNHLNPRWC
jgi:hypothetical protein